MKDLSKQAARWIARKSYNGAKSVGATVAPATVRYGKAKQEELKQWLAPTSPANWYQRGEEVLVDLSDALLREKRGVSQRVVQAFAGKLGMTGAPAAIYATAALIGTASTGTAIGSLSGAALNSATLAWVGGSMAAGSIIIAGAMVAGAIGAAWLSRWAMQRYLFVPVSRLTPNWGKLLRHDWGVLSRQ